MHIQSQKIIIIGGGIGGLITAIALNKKGIDCIIYEKSKSINSNGAGLALWANATSILDKFDLLDTILKHGKILSQMKLSSANGKHINIVNLNKLEAKFNYPSVVILRSDLQNELYKAIPASQIHFNKQCINVESEPRHVRVHFDDHTSEKADAVIIADGIHSFAREDIFHFPSIEYAGRVSWRGIAQFENTFLGKEISHEIFGDGRRIGIFPLHNNMAYWYAAVNMPLQEAAKQKRTIDCVQSHFNKWADPVNTLFNNTAEDKLILTNINYTSHINKLVKNNIALLGDAAHPMTPDLGQGACQALEDAYTIAECLTQNRSIEANFENYEAIRLQRVQKIAINSYRVGKLRQLGNPIGMAIRNNLFRFMPEYLTLKMLEMNIKHPSFPPILSE